MRLAVNSEIRCGKVTFKKVFLMGLASLLACSIMVACGQPAESPLTPATPQPPTNVENQAPAEASPPEEITNEAEWSTVQTFTGKESETTPPFHISGTEWRITWTADVQYPEYAVFDILIYPQDKPGMLTKRISGSEGTSGDTVYIYDGGCDYYLRVIAANLSNWTITVEDYAKQKFTSPFQITKINYKGMNYPNYEGVDYPEPGEASPRIVESDEYVEIKNLSDSPQNIAGWRLKNLTKGGPAFIFPTSLPCSCGWYGDFEDCIKNCYPPRPCEIEPHKSIRVYTGEAHYESGGFCFYYFLGDFWNNEIPDTAVLYNRKGQEVSRKSYMVPTKNSLTSGD
jgi:hypothetical protein